MTMHGRPPGYRNNCFLTPIGEPIDSAPQDQRYRNKMAKASAALLDAMRREARRDLSPPLSVNNLSPAFTRRTEGCIIATSRQSAQQFLLERNP